MRSSIIVMLTLLTGLINPGHAQSNPPDSVIIKVGESSKIIFAIDQDDIQTLKEYDFQALMNDMIKKLEEKDDSEVITPSSNYLKEENTTVVAPDEEVKTEYEWPQDNSDRNISRDDESGWVTYEGDDREYRSNERIERSIHRRRRTSHSLNFDLGTNNFMRDGKFPDSNNELYTVRPFGSWYVGINSIQRTQITKKFFVEWGLGVSWYNFKFQNDKTVIAKDDTGLIFSEDPRNVNYIKSKLTVPYINASLVPIIDFGGQRRKPMFFDGHNSRSFRIGAGPYIGYRIDSYTKQTYKENNDRKRDRNHDNFYLENIRYGARLQLGFQDVDLFFNYDMNDLFTAGKGPALNAFSFGISF